jgi:sugar lactone lactonase YvrE
MKARLIAVLALTAALATAGTVAAKPGKHDDSRSDRLALPNGWQPEGIASGHGNDLYVGSIPTGAVLRLDAKSGETEEAVPAQTGRAAIGLKVDRDERLFVAGGPTGDAFVYDGRSGADLAQFALAPEGQPTFVNDVALTRDAAYFTDSQRGSLYVVATDLSGFTELPLQGFEMQPGFNLNGIVAAKGGRVLLAVQSNAGRLWRIDPSSGESEAVDLGGDTLANGDGLLLKGRTLYVVQNRDNQIAVVKLSKRFGKGRVVRTITHPDFDVPTTIASKRGSLYAANARFDTAPEPLETAEYWVTRVSRDGHGHGHDKH